MNSVLSGTRRVFLDSAPIIYFVERHPVYGPILEPVFNQFVAGDLVPVTSPITLAECLALPMRLGRAELVEAFLEVIGGGHASVFVPIRKDTARMAADIRSRYNLTLTDAFQIATALQANCDALLTNDKDLTKVNDLRVILVNQLSL